MIILYAFMNVIKWNYLANSIRLNFYKIRLVL